MILCGIDLGLEGGIAWRAWPLTHPAAVSLYTTPTFDDGKGHRRYSTTEMRALLLMMVTAAGNEAMVTVFLEEPIFMPLQNVASAGMAGRGFGLWQGLCCGMGIRCQTVHPKTWQAAILKGIKGEDQKARSINGAQQLFPGVDFTRGIRKKKPSHDLADALNILEYACRTYSMKAV